MPPHLVIVGLGPHARYKYLPMFHEAMARGAIADYSVLELESARTAVGLLIESGECRASDAHFIRTPSRRTNTLTTEARVQLEDAVERHPDVRVVVATEARSHLPYLKWCLEQNVDCLVDKPIIAPVDAQGRFSVAHFKKETRSLFRLAERSRSHCSVMAPRRYHRDFEHFRRYVHLAATRLHTPITFISIYNAQGVWNLPGEIVSREDHPYKYGYGNLFHSGYHYVDLLCMLLQENEQVAGGRWDYSFKSHVARPSEERLWLSTDLTERLRPHRVDSFEQSGMSELPLGETDLVTSLAIRDAATKEMITLGNITLLQTSASLRSWRELPNGVYNRNGRFPLEELRVNLGFALSATLQVYKVPLQSRSVDSLEQLSRMCVWRNSNLLGCAATRCKERAASSDGEPVDSDLMGEARRRLFSNWLAGCEQRSTLFLHRNTMALLGLLASSMT